MAEGVSEKRKRTRRRREEIYIVDYAVSDSAKETVCAKLERLMLDEADRLVTERVS